MAESKLINNISIVESRLDAPTNEWNYRLWSDNTIEMWGVFSGVTTSVDGQNGATISSTEYPYTLITSNPVPVTTGSAWVNTDAFCYLCWVSTGSSYIGTYLRAPTVSTGVSCSVSLYVRGKITT